ncbi:hypothetical protein ACO0RG_000830 [Hanseniaspora osmophila]|uniref:Sphingolipid C4-hydroxylase SUR2 n=1 Tax=Hanseniaspora osmophila TaxID=56408 RepID=A0A1E5R293_9ASCO|nr:Sphingolipid C4-hydroxylase SUR2 [Hanseniaspora osmophila]
MNTNSTSVFSIPDLSFLNSPVPPTKAFYVDTRSVWNNIPDGIFALIAPVVAYWTFSLFFHIIDTYEVFEQYRIHPSEEVLKRNKAGRIEVLCEVLFQHLIQSVVGYVFYYFDKPVLTGYENHAMWQWKTTLTSSSVGSIFFSSLKPFSITNTLVNYAVYFVYQYGISFAKILGGFLIIDSWQYALHLLMHTNMTLYKKFHSRHHRLYVPYAYGALYNAPLEGFLLDTLGTGIAMLITGLSPREQIFLYTFATLKTVDDHCGYSLPYDPFQMIFPNNSVYHDIHHQPWGIKSNYAQPFFIFWDQTFNTIYPGYEEYRTQQRKVTIAKYKEFLANREKKKK